MNIATSLNKFRFGMAVKGIIRTIPVQLEGQELLVLSMVQHRDVLPYLLAVKSFCRYLNPARIVVVADPTLTAQDRVLMAKHVPAIEFREQAEFRKPGIPQGGCWERLCAVAEYVHDNYVIQLDSDTVAVAPMPEVVKAVQEQMAFTLGTEDDQLVQTCGEIAAWARGRLSDHDHVQLVAESRLDKIDGNNEYRYIRGCAGFAGYPRGSFSFATMALFSERMARVLPDRWHEWGTEQFTSNVIVASMPGARILPHPKYCAPHRRISDSAFFHFIGYVRYSTPFYAQLARKIATELRVA
ncbi:MAG: hypothetical protein IV101_09695 [Dechloromonas sp.]|uniref:hypothetical protein n=1 Tax=Dechloromonas sp. TaxID=1917218 RepID=UPI00280029BB|nr:hypothetical protein [Dechloromonas sp.]MBT9521158.1 hypothetical protein [Dechloromonas sp.]